MRTLKIKYVFLLFAASVFAIFTTASMISAGQTVYRLPIRLGANDVLTPDLLQGKNYRILDPVINDGVVNTYSLTTDYGPLTVESTPELLIRINELKAIAVMEEMEQEDVFGDALIEGVKAPVKGVGKLITSPVETTGNIIKGTGRFLSNVGSSLFSGDPDQDNVMKVALGYDVAKRQFAYKLGIDPYTDYNPVLERLGKISRAAVAGGIAPKAALGAIDHDIALAARASGTANSMVQLVRDNAPSELNKINKEKLKQMGIEDSLIDAFLENYRYNPQEETLLVGELATMAGVKGRDIFISKAVLAPNETVALSFRIRAQMMAGYHNNVKQVKEIRYVQGVITLLTIDDVAVLVAPVDYAFWTQIWQETLDAYEKTLFQLKKLAGKEAWISGKFDESVRNQFESRGWKIREDAAKTLIR